MNALPFCDIVAYVCSSDESIRKKKSHTHKVERKKEKREKIEMRNQKDIRKNSESERERKALANACASARMRKMCTIPAHPSIESNIKMV